MILRRAHQSILRFCILNQQIQSVLCVFVKPTSTSHCFLCKGQPFSCTCCWSFLYVGVQREMLLGKCCLATADSLFLLWLISPGWMEGPQRRSGSVWSKLLNYKCFSLPICLPLSLAGVICIHPQMLSVCLWKGMHACVRPSLPLSLSGSAHERSCYSWWANEWIGPRKGSKWPYWQCQLCLRMISVVLCRQEWNLESYKTVFVGFFP